MLPLLIRGFIVYIVLIASVRIMGKRQIGELQPSELVITFLLSQIASQPIESSETPLLGCLVSIVLLVSLEVISSVLIMKFSKLRNIIQGNSIKVISEGKIIEKNMSKLRFSVEDLMEALRLKDVFDISQVYTAYIETSGELSVKIKNENETVTLKDLKIKPEKDEIPILVVSDGKIIEKDLSDCKLTKEKLKKILRTQGIDTKDILIMTFTQSGNSNIVLKENKC